MKLRCNCCYVLNVIIYNVPTKLFDQTITLDNPVGEK